MHYLKMAEAIEIFQIQPEEFTGRLLDIRTESCHLTPHKYAAWEHLKIDCFDATNGLLDHFIRKVIREAPENILFHKGSLSNLPFNNECFDFVMAARGYAHFPDKEKTLEEIKRVLKPGGIFLGSTYVAKEKRFSDMKVKYLYDIFRGFHPHQESAAVFEAHLKRYFKLEVYQVRQQIAYFKAVKI